MHVFWCYPGTDCASTGPAIKTALFQMAGEAALVV